jgi:hypothetical protein
MLSAGIKAKRWTSINNSGRPAVAEQSLTSTERVNPAALAVEDAARALGLPVDAIRQDIAQGAPTNADGSVNLVHYAAWLNGKLADGD